MSKKAAEDKRIQINPPKIERIAFNIVGTAPYVQLAFSEKARLIMEGIQKAGHLRKKGEAREGKDFEALYHQAMHETKEGWRGIPAAAFRKAMISACRIVGFKMTLAKLGVFVQADGISTDGIPLVKITKGKPEMRTDNVRNANGSADIRARGMWREGWEANLKVMYDADMFTASDITNLLLRVGQQVGVGEGRPDSKMSSGMGWGTFDIK